MRPLLFWPLADSGGLQPLFFFYKVQSIRANP